MARYLLPLAVAAVALIAAATVAESFPGAVEVAVAVLLAAVLVSSVLAARFVRREVRRRPDVINWPPPPPAYLTRAEQARPPARALPPARADVPVLSITLAPTKGHAE